ncbi:putative RNA helicase SDE3 [Forsythia ovata]|uniref:RNA helicase SDE3 n=1 Tax=Forsythia ovata TaxID=205694 RepID=A0ABD1U4P4_9LAMI
MERFSLFKTRHHATTVASEALLRNLLFPEFIPENNVTSMELFIDPKLDKQQISSLQHILSLKGSPPYIIEGPMSRIPETDMFRAYAAFRELDGVPLDMFQSCSYEDKTECFSCPRLKELEKFQVILTAFVSSFQLYAEGVKTGHFSHIFLVDASSSTEPEAMVPLANFTNDQTAVVITGTPNKNSGWIRSPIARNNGLKVSYFERLRDSKLYRGLDPKVITLLKNAARKSDGTFGSFN